MFVQSPEERRCPECLLREKQTNKKLKPQGWEEELIKGSWRGEEREEKRVWFIQSRHW